MYLYDMRKHKKNMTNATQHNELLRTSLEENHQLIIACSRVHPKWSTNTMTPNRHTDT